MRKRYALKNRTRFFAFVSAVAVIAFTALYAATVYAFKEKPYRIIEVKSGDTLWEIAQDYGGGNDVRRYIFEIERINGLSGGLIYAGTSLKLPAN